LLVEVVCYYSVTNLIPFILVKLIILNLHMSFRSLKILITPIQNYTIKHITAVL